MARYIPDKRFYFLIIDRMKKKTGGGNAIAKYKPLIKVIDFHGNEYFTEKSYAQVRTARDTCELLDFPFSGDCIKASNIVRHRQADPEEVILAWKIQKLTYWQKESIRAGVRAFNEHFNFAKPLTEKRMDGMIENVKAGKPAFAPISNG